MVQAKITNGEPRALATGVHKWLPGQVLRSLAIPARRTEPHRLLELPNMDSVRVSFFSILSFFPIYF